MAKKKIGNAGFGGAGESGAARSGSDATYKELFLAVRAELDDLRTKYAAVLAKLDAGDTADFVAEGGLADATFEA